MQGWSRFFLALVLALTLPLVAPLQPVFAKSAHKDEIKVPPNYVTLPKLRLAVPMDENGQYRMLELEVWLAFKTPEEAMKVGTFKASVAETMKTEFLTHSWDAFLDPEEGVELAKSIVKDCVTKTIKDGPPVDEVLIRRMIMR